jgi:hypothetical protein
MLSCGFWRLKPCGQKNEGKQQVNAQKQDGLMLNTGVLRGGLLPSPPSARLVARLTLPSFMWTRRAAEPTRFAASATKRLANSVGTQGQNWIDGHLATTNTASPRNSYLSCMPNRKENVQSAAMNRKRLGVCTLIIATNQAQFGDCYATAATQALGRSKRVLRRFSKQSVI